ncbi:twin-arginine translocase TatA/TatE family subunit [Blastococcus sp. SYSU DS1021]
MSDSIGWGMVVLALVAFFIFGPDRLPSLSRDAAGALRRVRRAVTDIRRQIGEEVGEDLTPLRDLDLRRYHPRTLLREHVLVKARTAG